jgi:hypothetical protein
MNQTARGLNIMPYDEVEQTTQIPVVLPLCQSCNMSGVCSAETLPVRERTDACWMTKFKRDAREAQNDKSV